MGLTVKALCEALVKHPKTTAKQVGPLKKLAEMDGMADMTAPVDAPPADDADPADGVKEAFKTAVLHIVDQAMDGEMDPKEALGKIKKLLASHGEVNGTTTDDADADADTGADDAVPEGKRPNLAGLVAECRAKQFAATADDLAALSEIRTAEGRALVIDRLKDNARPGETPRSSGRPPVREERTGDGKTAPTMEEIKKRIRA